MEAARDDSDEYLKQVFFEDIANVDRQIDIEFPLCIINVMYWEQMLKSG